jgi:uncharacterized protein (TIGR02145 family)
MFSKLLNVKLLLIILITTTVSCKKDSPIIKKDAELTWLYPADIVYGTLLSVNQLNASSNVAGTYVYTPPIGTLLNAGASQNLKVDFTPSDLDHYKLTSKTIPINVLKREPIITWANPEDIFLPTPLSAVQLNATADVPGTFTYAPLSGKVLSIGEAQNLKADFTPSDIANNKPSSKTVTINIKGRGTVTDYDGNVYDTLHLGTQLWMVEDLKVTHYRNGDPIASVTDSVEWLDLSTGSYCWYNNIANSNSSYGALYNWYATTDARNIAPEGWHVPTDAEWSVLITFLGGENTAGIKMKEAGFSHWIAPNTGAYNTSGFTAVPSGYRFYNFGQFSNRGDYGIWWSSSTSDANNDPGHAWCRDLNTNNTQAFRTFYQKISGFSVRCIHD